jgi:hypothetical protein
LPRKTFELPDHPSGGSMKILLGVASFLLLGSAALKAQTTAAPQGAPPKSTPFSAASNEPKKIDPTKEADIRKLLEVTNTTAHMQQLMEMMEKNIKPMMAKALPEGDYREKLVNLFFERFHSKLDLQRLLDLAVPIYDKYLSDEEIKGLIQFYQTPLGQKALKALPQLTAEMAEAGQKMGERIGRESMMEILSEHPEFEKAIEDAQKQSQ